MKLLLLAALIAALQLPARLFADAGLSADDVIIETLLPDGSTNTWTRSDLAAALGLINRKYHREVDAATGTVAHRKEWHGRLISEIINTNDLTRTQIYEDGMAFVDPWAAPVPVPTPPPAPEMKGNIPEKLWEARQRRKAEKATTNIVEIVHTAGK